MKTRTIFLSVTAVFVSAYFLLWLGMTFFMTPPVLQRIDISVGTDRSINPISRENVRFRLDKRTFVVEGVVASKQDETRIKEVVLAYSDQLQSARIKVRFSLEVNEDLVGSTDVKTQPDTNRTSMAE